MYNVQRFQVLIMICLLICEFVSYIRLLFQSYESHCLSFLKRKKEILRPGTKMEIVKLSKYCFVTFILETYGAFVLDKRTKKTFGHLCKKQLINYFKLFAFATD